MHPAPAPGEVAITSLFRRVLVGWDASPSAAAALRMGCAVTAFPGGIVLAVSVVASFDQVEAVEDRRRAAADARRPLQTGYEQTLARLKTHPDQQVSLRFVEDHHVAEALDRLAAEESIDLLIVGLHGSAGLLHPKIGHIAHHVVTAATCPVLVIPDPARPATAHRDQASHLTSAIRGLFHPGHHRPGGDAG